MLVNTDKNNEPRSAQAVYSSINQPTNDPVQDAKNQEVHKLLVLQFHQLVHQWPSARS